MKILFNNKNLYYEIFNNQYKFDVYNKNINNLNFLIIAIHYYFIIK